MVADVANAFAVTVNRSPSALTDLPPGDAFAKPADSYCGAGIAADRPVNSYAKYVYGCYDTKLGTRLVAGSVINSGKTCTCWFIPPFKCVSSWVPSRKPVSRNKCFSIFTPSGNPSADRFQRPHVTSVNAERPPDSLCSLFAESWSEFGILYLCAGSNSSGLSSCVVQQSAVGVGYVLQVVHLVDSRPAFPSTIFSAAGLPVDQV